MKRRSKLIRGAGELFSREKAQRDEFKFQSDTGKTQTTSWWK
jgi:hypothetical protein